MDQPTPKSKRLLALEKALDDSALGPVELLTLDDSEVVALSDGVRLPWCPTIELADPAAVAAARERGAASLALRDERYEPADLLRLTQSWRVAVVLEQQTAESRAQVVAYLRADGYASLEDVPESGAHRFVAVRRAAALDLLTATATPTGDHPDDPMVVRTYGAQEWEDAAPELVGDALVVSIAHVLLNPFESPDPARPESRRLVVHALVDRIVTAEPVDGRLEVRTVSRASLRRRLHELATVS